MSVMNELCLNVHNRMYSVNICAVTNIVTMLVVTNAFRICFFEYLNNKLTSFLILSCSDYHSGARVRLLAAGAVDSHAD